ncbi:MAG TPA: site-2 protease family protein [Bacteroidota bacterium]|nr:site-2 protease family protein [Bacteroidota bacterium]
MDSLYVIPILLFSVVVHEVAHGLMALKLGDPTAKELGRLTLNPIPHIDPLGSIFVPLISYLAAGSVFIAWAKPVPINPANFKNYRRDDILVSIVGPFSNLIVALLCTIGYILVVNALGLPEAATEGLERHTVKFLAGMFSVGITLNIFLAVFNLIPVPPLDGSHVLASLLPQPVGDRYRQIGFMGIFLIIVLMRVDAFRSVILSIVTTLLVPYRSLISLFA